MKYWAVITGAGTGIGAALAKELTKHDLQVLAIGRRLDPLLQMQKEAPFSEAIFPLAADISTRDGQQKIFDTIPADNYVKFLVQNAAVGVPSRLEDIKQEDFEYAMAVNVTAPLMLTKGFLPQLKRSGGRVLHLGTNVAFKAQLGTTTYGVTKMAFHRLYEQLKVELAGSGVFVATVHPGVVDTEGLWEHIRLANQHQLPHVAYFGQVQKEGKMLTAEFSAKFLTFVLMETKDEEFSQEWHIHDEKHWSKWKKD